MPMARLPSSSASDTDADDDEKVERQTLVSQIEAKHPTSLSALETSHHPSRTHRRSFCSSTRCLLLFAVLISFLLVLLLFSPSSSHNAPPEGTRESELRALFLLRNQQSGLLRLWNRTRSIAIDGAPHPPSSALNSARANLSKAAAAFDEFRSALLEQIRLNTQIQNALLSSHEAGNSSSGASDDNVDLDMSGLGADLCKKVDGATSRRTIEWKPKKDRYLFAICASGQMSNHVICLEKHMFFAALLDRVLILPSPKFDYKYTNVMDVRLINECFGRKVVITFHEFSEAHKNKNKIDRFICYIASPPCYLDEDHINGLKSLGLSLAKFDAAWPEDAKLKTQKKRAVGEIKPKFTSNFQVLATGDLFYANVEEEWLMQPGGPLQHKCKTVIQPSRLIFLTAQRFVQTFLGSNFIALHFRRHWFLKFW